MDFLVPKLSATMESAKVLRWLKQPGDKIKSGDPLVELETDKAAMEVESPVDGVLGAIAAAEGADVAIGGKLADIAEAGGAAAALPGHASRPVAAAQGARATPAGATAASGPCNHPLPKPTAVAAALPRRQPAVVEGGPARILASPLARRAGARAGPSTSPRWPAPRAPASARPTSSPHGAPPPPRPQRRGIAPPQAAPSDGAAVPLTAMRARIAETVTVSRQTIPAFDARPLRLDRGGRPGEGDGSAADIERDAGVKLTLTDFFLQALADTLFHNPAMLQRFADAGGRPGSVRDGTVDVGLVVAVDGGMMIPVVPDLGGRSLAEIGIARRDATQRVRSGRLGRGRRRAGADRVVESVPRRGRPLRGDHRTRPVVGAGRRPRARCGGGARRHSRGGDRRLPHAVGRPPADRRHRRRSLPRPARRPHRIRPLAGVGSSTRPTHTKALEVRRCVLRGSRAPRTSA